MSYSRRQLEAFGEPLGESSTHARPGGSPNERVYGGGGGGPTSSTVTQTNIPEYARPYVEAMLGGALQESFDIDTSDGQYTIKGVKPYKPYSLDPREYIAGFSPLQQAAFAGAENLQVPGQIGAASDLTYEAAQRAGGAGDEYFARAMTPQFNQALMSPYMQNVVDRQMASARTQADITRQQRQAALAKAGGFGGARHAIEEAEASKALNSQLGDIQAKGLQSAFEQAIQQQQFGTSAGLQGLGQAGAMAGQLGQLGGQQLGAQQGILGLQSQYGGQQQQQQQQVINQAIQNYATAQQYPQMQLGFLNAMIRGMATPTTTTQSYQAAPPITSQLAGLGLTGYGLAQTGMFGGATGKKAGGTVHSGGGLNDLAMYQIAGG